MKMNVYEFMAVIADRRTKEYKILELHLDTLCQKYGKESNEVNLFFDSELEQTLSNLMKTEEEILNVDSNNN